MSRVIPNGQVWIGFTTTAPASANLSSITEAEIDAATDLTNKVASINPTSQGNAIPAPALDSLFDRSVVGTSQGNFTGDFYRDDAADVAWDALPRGTRGWFFIQRFGGSRTTPAGNPKPGNGDSLEVWPVEITQRAGSPLTTNQIQTFTVTAAVPEIPNEDATVTASSGVPSAPLNVVATAGATGIANVDWDAPVSGAPITGYKVYKATTVGGAYTEITTNITKLGTTAHLVTQTAGATFYKVLATNAAGDGPQSVASNGITVL
jgi:hypothetical protein